MKRKGMTAPDHVDAAKEPVQPDEPVQMVDGEPVRYDLLPDHLRGGMARYIEHKIKPGDFLSAVLTNDLMVAVFRWDGMTELLDVVRWVYNQAPPACFGSREKFKEWLKS